MLKNRPSKPRLHGSRSPPKRPTPRHGRRRLRPARVSRSDGHPGQEGHQGHEGRQSRQEGIWPAEGEQDREGPRTSEAAEQHHARRTYESNLLASPKRPWVLLLLRDNHSDSESNVGSCPDCRERLKRSRDISNPIFTSLSLYRVAPLKDNMGGRY